MPYALNFKHLIRSGGSGGEGGTGGGGGGGENTAGATTEEVGGDVDAGSSACPTCCPTCWPWF